MRGVARHSTRTLERTLPETPYAPPTTRVADPPDPAPVKLGRYVGIFSAALMSVIAATLLVVVFAEYEANGSIGLIQTLFAASLTGALFVRRNRRIPTPSERRKLVWMSLIASLLIAVVSMGGFLGYLAASFGLDDLRQGISEAVPALPLFVWGMVIVVTLAVTYVTLHLGYGFMTTQFGKQLLKDRAL